MTFVNALKKGAQTVAQAARSAKKIVNDYISGDEELAAQVLSEGYKSLKGKDADARAPTHPVTVTHQIKHTSFWAALAGAVAGALVTAGVAAVVILAAKFLAAAAGIGAVAGGVVFAGKVLVFVVAGLTVGERVKDWVTKKLTGTRANDGPVIAGSPNVFVAGRPAGRGGIDPVACVKHVRNPPPRIAEGSKTVCINGYPFARIDDRTECGAPLKQGVTTVLVGGPTATVLEVGHEFNWFQRLILFAAEIMIPPQRGLLNLLKGGFLKLGRGLLAGVKWAAKSLAKLRNGAVKLFQVGVQKAKNMIVSAAHWSAKKASEAWSATKAMTQRIVEKSQEMLRSAKVSLTQYKNKVIRAAHKGAEATKTAVQQFWNKIKGPPAPPASPPPPSSAPPSPSAPPPSPSAPPPSSTGGRDT